MQKKGCGVRSLFFMQFQPYNNNIFLVAKYFFIKKIIFLGSHKIYIL